MFELNAQAMSSLRSYDSTLTEVSLVSTPQLEWLALFMGWEGFLIESLVGLSFLLPGSWALGRWRDVLLLLFVATTYALVPVFGFAWIVLIMGLASHSGRMPYPKVVYTTVFLLVYIYQFPWHEMGGNLGLIA